MTWVDWPAKPSTRNVPGCPRPTATTATVSAVTKAPATTWGSQTLAAGAPLSIGSCCLNMPAAAVVCRANVPPMVSNCLPLGGLVHSWRPGRTTLTQQIRWWWCSLVNFWTMTSPIHPPTVSAVAQGIFAFGLSFFQKFHNIAIIDVFKYDGLIML